MKILHINGTSEGGTANFAINLHQNLLNKNFKSSIFLPNYKNNLANVYYPKSCFYKLSSIIKIKIVRILNKYLFKIKSTVTLGIFNSYFIKKLIKKINPQILHLHWLGNEIMSLKDINEIKIPIVVTMHDMWFISPIEHYSEENDKKFQHSKLKSFFLKKAVYQKKKISKKINYIFTSEWMKSQGIKSGIIQNSLIYKIGCGIDFQKWKSIDKLKAKKKLNLDINKKYILFSSNGLSRRKGFDLFVEAIKKLNQDVRILISSDEAPKNQLKFKYHFFQNLNDTASRSLLYSASDLCIIPSRQEAFGLVCLEAAACNTPSVIPSDTGLTEIIKHKINGFVIKKNNPKEIIEGIEWILKKLNDEENYFKNIRETVKHFDIKQITKQHIELYKNILK
jgi:glycosyltransferase involved in cell wall biosynthesis